MIKPNVHSISSNTVNVRQDVFPLDKWTITTRKGIIMQSKCTCKSVEQQQSQLQLPEQYQLQQQQQQQSQNPVEKDLDREPIELCDICRYHRFLPQLNAMPDMLFNNNLLRLEHLSGVGIEFNPLDALRLVEETKDPLKVAVADGWQSARADCPFAKNVTRPFDWTFTTSYRGTLLAAIKESKKPARTSSAPKNLQQEAKIDRSQEQLTQTANEIHQSSESSELNYSLGRESISPHIMTTVPAHVSTTTTNHTNTTLVKDEYQPGRLVQPNEEDRLYLTVEETDERIDVNKLKVREEILFYDDVTLYEDELADHGTAQYSIKVRVMPSSLFILARYYLRIDGVLARINDTRIYHELSENYILREYTNREAKLSGLNLPVSTVVNPSELMNHLPLIQSRFEKLILPSALDQ